MSDKMIFKKLELKNFKSHANTTIDFNEGITLVVGENGAGKSSIFEAISFALFKVQSTKISDIVRSNKNIGEKIEMFVKLTFLNRGKTYRVERTNSFTKSSNKSNSILYEISDAGEIAIASGNKEVDNEIKLILSMDSSTFLNAIHIKQGEISALIDEQPAKKKELISKLLKIDDLEIAYKKLPEVLKEYETKQAVLEDRVVSESELNYDLKQKKEKCFYASKMNNELKEKLESLKIDIGEETKKKEILDKEKTQFKELKIKSKMEEKYLTNLNESKLNLTNKLGEIIRSENEMNTLKPATEKLPIFKEFKESILNFNKYNEEKVKIKEELSKINGFKEIISKEKESHEKFLILENEIKTLENKKAELNSDLKQIKDLEKQKENLTNDLNKSSKKLELFYNNSIDILSNLNDVTLNNVNLTNVNSNNLDNFLNISSSENRDNENSKKDSILNDLNIDSIETNEDFIKLESFVENLRTKIRNEIDSLNVKIEDMNKETLSLTHEIKSVEEPLADIKKVDNKCPICQSDISDEKKNELINSYQSTITINTKKISENTEELSKLKKINSINENCLKDLDSIKTNIYQNKHLIEDISKSKLNLEDINEKIKNLQEKKEMLSELEERFNKKEEEYKSLEINHKNYEEAQTLLKSAQDESKLNDELYSLEGKIKLEDKKLKKLISQDSELSLNVDLKELDKSIKDLTDKTTKYNILLGSIKGKEDIESELKSTTENLEIKTKELIEIKKQLTSSNYNEESHRNLALLLDRLNNNFNQISQEIAVNENNIVLFRKDIESVEEMIKLNRQNKEELIAINKYLSLLYYFREVYSKDGIQKDLKSQSRPLIQNYTREFFNKFNFNFSDLILNEDYDISVFGPEGEAKIDMVSGGEKIAIALSLRLGITQAMSKGNIETILLDEPTIHLDSARRSDLINVFRSMSVIPQMIIITHDDELESAADTIIKVDKSEGISHIELD